MLQFLDTAIAFAVIMLMLSLLITAVVQLISSLFDLRGWNLALHVEMLLNQIDPEFRELKVKGKSVANVVARAVVCHPSVAQGASTVSQFLAKSRMAKALTSEELVAVLKDLASEKPAGDIHGDAKRVLQRCFKIVDGKGEAHAIVSAIDEQLRKQYPQIADGVKDLINETAGKINRVEHGVEQWFDTVMNRSGDLFLRYTRAITIGAAVVVAVFFQIDARQIAQQLYTNAAMRDSFVKMADATIAQADKILENSKRGKAAIDRLLVAEENALKDARTKLSNAQSSTPPNTADSADAQKAIAKHESAVKLLSAAPADLENCRSAAAWLSAERGADQDLQTALNNTCQQVTQEAMGVAGDQIKDIKNKLERSDLKLMAIGKSYWGSFKDGYHVLGILGTIVLLSFGAPFWFDTLGQLVKLRPIVASKVATQEAEAEVVAAAVPKKAKAAAAGK